MDHIVTGLLAEAFLFVPYAYSGMLETFILSEQWSVSNKYIHNRKKKNSLNLLKRGKNCKVLLCSHLLELSLFFFDNEGDFC